MQPNGRKTRPMRQADRSETAEQCVSPGDTSVQRGGERCGAAEGSCDLLLRGSGKTVFWAGVLCVSACGPAQHPAHQWHPVEQRQG